MRFSLIFSKRYGKEVEKIVEYYESVQDGLGARFRKALNAALDKLETHPFAFAAVPDMPLRRIGLDGFPYSVYYRIVGQDIRIQRCYSTDRKPLYPRPRRRS